MKMKIIKIIEIMKMKKLACIPLLCMLLSGCTLAQAVSPDAGEPGTVTEPETAVFQDGDVEVYSGDPYITALHTPVWGWT